MKEVRSSIFLLAFFRCWAIVKKRKSSGSSLTCYPPPPRNWVYSDVSPTSNSFPKGLSGSCRQWYRRLSMCSNRRTIRTILLRNQHRTFRNVEPIQRPFEHNLSSKCFNTMVSLLPLITQFLRKIDWTTYVGNKAPDVHSHKFSRS